MLSANQPLNIVSAEFKAGFRGSLQDRLRPRRVSSWRDGLLEIDQRLLADADQALPRVGEIED